MITLKRKKPTRILLLPVSAGYGHIKAAAALEKGFKEIDAHVQVINEDAFKYAGPIIKGIYKNWYAFSIRKMPQVYGFLYRETNKFKKIQRIMDKPRLLFEEMNSFRLEHFISKFNPDIIVSLHILPESLVSFWKKRKKLKNVRHFVIMTDYGGHRLWIQPEVDRYYVAHEDVAAFVKFFEVPDERIRTLGIPVNPQFSLKRIDKNKIKREIGIANSKPTAFMFANGLVEDVLLKSMKSLANVSNGFNLVISAERESTRKIIKEQIKKYRFKAIIKEYIKNVQEYMAVSDVLISKSGGLVVSEALAMGLPMIVLSPIPGQEEINATFLLENEAGLMASNPEILGYKLRNLINDSERLSQIKKNAARLGKPNSAANVAKDMITV